MVVSGALDGLPGITRAQYFSADSKGSSFLESLIRYGSSVKNIRNSSQQSLFGDSRRIRAGAAGAGTMPRLVKTGEAQ